MKRDLQQLELLVIWFLLVFSLLSTCFGAYASPLVQYILLGAGVLGCGVHTAKRLAR